MSHEHKKCYFAGFSKMHIYISIFTDQHNMQFITIPRAKINAILI